MTFNLKIILAILNAKNKLSKHLLTIACNYKLPISAKAIMLFS